MPLRVVAVFHSLKVSGLAADLPVEIRANPTLSIPGMVHVQSIVENIHNLGPFNGPIYSSHEARALDTASVLALALNMEIASIRSLGPYANTDSDGKIHHYPGHEHGDHSTWQQSGALSMQRLWKIWMSRRATDTSVLVVSHKPIIGGLVALARGVNRDNDAIKAVVDEIAINQEIMERGYMIFRYSPQNVEVVV